MSVSRRIIAHVSRFPTVRTRGRFSVVAAVIAAIVVGMDLPNVRAAPDQPKELTKTTNVPAQASFDVHADMSPGPPKRTKRSKAPPRNLDLPLKKAPLWPTVDVRNVDDRAVPAALRQSIQGSPEPLIGKGHVDYPSGKVVPIRVETPDYPQNPHATSNFIWKKLFDMDGPEPSVARYFSENSWGDFIVTSGGFPGQYVALSKKLSDYRTSDGIPYAVEGHAGFARDVLARASLDWRLTDTNKDGVISRSEAQIVFLIPMNNPNAPDGLPKGWASVRNVTVGSVTIPGGKQIDFGRRPIIYYGLRAASAPDSDTMTIPNLPQLCHLLTHAFFGTPDRSWGPGGNGWTGRYCITSDNCNWIHLNLHDKMKIGWIQPKIVTPRDLGDGLRFIFPASEKTRAALILAVEGWDEYWILQNLHRPSSSGMERGLPESGLAVWWVRSQAWPANAAGHWARADDVRLVDASNSNPDPDGAGTKLDANHVPTPVSMDEPGFFNQGPGALFQPLGKTAVQLFRRAGTPGPFTLLAVSEPDDTLSVVVQRTPLKPDIVERKRVTPGDVTPGLRKKKE